MCDVCKMFHVKQCPAQFYSLTQGTGWTGEGEKLRKLPDGLTPASGYAVDVEGKRHHLGKVTLARARRFAMARGNAEISEAIGVADADQFIWRKLETIDREPGGLILRPDGELMLKQSPEGQVEEQTDKYAAALLLEYKKWAKTKMREYFNEIDVDWYEVKDVDAVFQQAGEKVITGGKDQKDLSAAWGGAALLYLQQAAAQAREFTRGTFLPKIGSSITSGDKLAMKALAEMPGFFIRDHLGNVSKGLTKRGREIVMAGKRDSIGYREIGKELRDQLPGMWAKYGNNYANVVANAGVQRARAFAEISSYVEAGIEYAELVAVIDQRTTDCCRFLNGQHISVSNVTEILNRTLEITNPEDIRKVTPWVNNRRNPDTGQMQLVTRNGVVLADILRSGYGKIDDRGQFAARKMGDQLAIDASIGPPPYHGRCRTTMNPVVRTFSVPAGKWRQAIPTVPPKPKEASTLTTASALRGLTLAASVGALSTGNRPANTGELPTDKKPVHIGDPIDPETGEYASEGWIEDRSADVQVSRRVKNAMVKLQNALNEIYRANGREDLSLAQKGTILRDIFKRRIAELRGGSKVRMEKIDHSFQSVERVRGDMPHREADAIRRYAFGYLSDRMLKVVKRRKLPRIVNNRSSKSQPVGHWDRAQNVFHLPKMETAKSQAIILRVFAHYLDTFGHNGEAAIADKGDSLVSNEIFQYNDIMFSDVATPSIYSGLMYNEPRISEWTASAFEALALPANLGFLWDIAPRHVAFLMSYIEGQFV